MNKRLNDALTKVRALPDEQQKAVADLLFDYLEAPEKWLSKEQIAEIERRLDDNDIAGDEEARAVFDRLKQ